MSGFFLSETKKTRSLKRPAKQGKQISTGRKAQNTTPAKKKQIDNEQLESDEESLSGASQPESEGYESEESETAQEKKIRLTKQYLAQLKEEEQQKSESQDIDHDAIAHRLQQDLLEQSGRFQRQIARQFSAPDSSSIKALRGHHLAVTCICVSSDDKYVFTGSKDCYIIKWNVHSGKKEGKIAASKDTKDSKGCVLALCISSDDNFLASGGKDKVIHIWDPTSLQSLHSFTGHRDTITGLAFRKETHQLFSCSADKTVKIWNLDEMAYVETLYGHQDGVTAIDSLARDRAVTTGGRDKSLRMWKVVEETQLVFNGHGGCMDCIKMISEDHIMTGADDGSICIWNTSKKKPVCTVTNAHGKETSNTTDEIPDETWITSLTAVKNTDLVASGSCDSCIRLWKCGPGYRSLNLMFTIPVAGFVNCLAFSNDGSTLFAGVGQEHRLGRWWRLKNAKNAMYVIPLQKSLETADSTSNE